MEGADEPDDGMACLLDRSSLFKPTLNISEEGALRLAAGYHRALEALLPRQKQLALESRLVETRYGATEVLVAGPRAARPLVLWQAKAAPPPFMLAAFEQLAHAYRVYVPDMPDEAGSRSDPVRLRAQSYGKWAHDVVRTLGLVSDARGPPLHVGMSFGGGLVLDLAAVAPASIAAAALVMPIRLDPGWGGAWFSLRLALRCALPMALYHLLPCAATRLLMLSAMFDEPRSADPAFRARMDQLALSLRYQRAVHELLPRVEADALLEYSAPTLVLAGAHDVFGQGERTAARARGVLRDCEAVVLPCKHGPAPEVMAIVNERILDFFVRRGFPP